jgi:sugar/nucleoside kinase (ribokinase family)
MEGVTTASAALGFEETVSKAALARNATTPDVFLSVSFIGDAFLDVQASGIQSLKTITVEDSDTRATSIIQSPGGCCTNTARQFASFVKEKKELKEAVDSFNFSCKLFAAIGSEDDSSSNVFLKAIQDEGVLDLSNVARIAGKSISTCIVLSTSTDRSFVSCNSSNDECIPPSPTLLPFQFPKCYYGPEEEEYYKTARKRNHLHIGGLFNCRQLRTSKALLALCDTAHSISLDTASDATGLWGRKRTPNQENEECSNHTDEEEDEIFWELFAKIDIFLPSLSEVMKIADKDNLDDATNFFLDKNPKVLLIIKRGIDGSLAVWRNFFYGHETEGHYSMPCPVDQLEQCVDTCGAGDAFNAGFLYVFLSYMCEAKQGYVAGVLNEEEFPLLKALCAGNICGTACCKRVGALQPNAAIKLRSVIGNDF